jgi:hypothetical protein
LLVTLARRPPSIDLSYDPRVADGERVARDDAVFGEREGIDDGERRVVGVAKALNESRARAPSAGLRGEAGVDERERSPIGAVHGRRHRGLLS